MKLKIIALFAALVSALVSSCQLFYMPGSFDNYAQPVWQYVGSPRFSSGQAGSINLAFNNGIPYVAFQDQSNGYKVSVMYYSNSNWNYLGGPGFSSEKADAVCLAIIGGTPYIAYVNTASGAVPLMVFTNGAWTNLGSANDNGWGISLSFYNNMPYLAVSTGINIMLEYFSNGTWQKSDTGFSADNNGGTGNISLAFANGAPYIAYEDNDYGGKATVITRTNSLWTNLGSRGINSGRTPSLELIFQDGIPYVACQEQASGHEYNETKVMVYSNGQWNTLGNTLGSSPTSFVFHNGIPYLTADGLINGSVPGVWYLTNGAWSQVGPCPMMSSPDLDSVSLAFNGDVPYFAFPDVNSKQATVMLFR